MPVASMVVLTVWTLVALRVVGARATLGLRTFGIYLLLGALLGITCIPLVRGLAAPYGEQGLYVNYLFSLGFQAVLLLPAIWLLLRRANEVTSLADVFLLAFMAGFGFDLLGAILAASTAATPLKGLSIWPPWQFDGENFSVAGYGYWSGLVALVIGAAMRFGRLAFSGCRFRRADLFTGRHRAGGAAIATASKAGQLAGVLFQP